jgi:predicted DNA-binding transcriptional regulator AlpA
MTILRISSRVGRLGRLPSQGLFVWLASIAMLLPRSFVMARIIDWKILSTMVPYCRQHIARLEKVGNFPQRVRLGEGPRSRTGWVHDEVVTWIKARMNDRTPREERREPVLNGSP